MADNHSIDLNSLKFYFDAQQKDGLDRCGRGRKAGEVAALRERLLSLPDPEFDATIKTLQKLVNDPKAANTDQDKEQARLQRQASIELFEQREGGAGSGERVDKI